LTPNTRYFWKVVAKNASASSTSPLWKFKTQAVISTFPWEMGFEGEDSLTININYPLLSGWTYPTTGSGSWHMNDHSTPNYAHQSTFCAYCTPWDSGYYTLMTPKFNIDAPKSLSFWWKSYVSGSVDSTFFEVTYDGGNTWQTLDTLTTAAAMQNYVREIYIINSGNNVYFRWRYYLAHIQGMINTNKFFLDDITVSNLDNTPEIHISPSLYNFRELFVNGTTTTKVVVSNWGNGALNISGLSINPPFSTTYTGSIIQPNASDTIEIRLNATETGTPSQTVTFNINGAFNGDNHLLLNATILANNPTLFEAFDAVSLTESIYKTQQHGLATSTFNIQQHIFGKLSLTTQLAMH